MKRLLRVIFIISWSLSAKSLLLAAVRVPAKQEKQLSLKETVPPEATKEQCKAVEQQREFYEDLQKLAPKGLKPYFGQRSKDFQKTLEQCELPKKEEKENED